MKKLYLFRHAKASQPPGGPDDHARPLADRGAVDAAAIGQRLIRLGAVPGVVLCSSARRAVESLEHAFPSPAAAVETAVDKSLYTAGPGQVLQRVRGLDDAVSSAMVVGHNPTLGVLAERLAGSGDPDLLAELAEKFPTAAVAGLEFDTDRWREVGPGLARLAFLLTPKML